MWVLIAKVWAKGTWAEAAGEMWTGRRNIHRDRLGVAKETPAINKNDD